MKRIFCTSVFVLAGVVISTTFADDYDLSWHSIDAGGGLVSSGEFELQGTIGHPGASTSALTGGHFELVGGFWVAAAPACRCPADMNGDGKRDANDIQAFIACIVSPGALCACADVDGVPGLDLNDVQAFVDSLLEGEPCS